MGGYLGRDREPRRQRQAEIAHFGEVGALAAEQVAHLGPPLGAVAAKTVDPFRHGLFHLSNCRRRRLAEFSSATPCPREAEKPAIRPRIIPRSGRSRRPGSLPRGCATADAAGFPAVPD